MGFFYVHCKLSIAEALRGDLPSRLSVVSRRPLTEPLLVVRRSPDWRRPSWAFNQAGADSGCTSVTLADERSVLWSAVVKPGGVLAIGSNHPDGDQGLMVERTESAIGPLLVGTDSTAEVFVDPRYLTRVRSASR
ncbi:hypothetical protein [Gordonia amicalis]|uniref:hypothetical protein n=1 Tax=Gordonia amicalis TaxID=89053 RepID=UPI0024B9F97F|nr:hypothetical protein [Gordonia amicalis]MDJ0455471.1 hypothetical protein [Gordonia amicalis]MDV7078936.1 hypothetical protein [Gordonia amicalis]